MAQPSMYAISGLYPLVYDSGLDFASCFGINARVLSLVSGSLLISKQPGGFLAGTTVEVTSEGLGSKKANKTRPKK